MVKTCVQPAKNSLSPSNKTTGSVPCTLCRPLGDHLDPRNTLAPEQDHTGPTNFAPYDSSASFSDDQACVPPTAPITSTSST